MIMSQLFVLLLAFALHLTLAALFPEDSLVKMIGHKEFKAAMKENMTSVVAFLIPSCDDCQRLVPEYNNAALGLYPFVPLYAVDCNVTRNKRLCADQSLNGFPTVKLFPRGKYIDPAELNSTRPSASEIYYFAQYGIPSKLQKVHYFEDLYKINDENIMNKHRTLLLKKPNQIPLVWLVLANKYGDDIGFFSHRDWRGGSSVKMGFEAGGEGESKVLIFPAGETNPVLFKGILKLDSLSNFFDSLLNGDTNIEELNAIAAAEKFVPDPKELEIERQQEAEMLKLAHGGFANLIDFEAVVRDGSAKSFRGKQGYPGMTGGTPKTVGFNADDKDQMQRARMTSSSTSKSKKVWIPITDEAGQITIDASTRTDFAVPTDFQVVVSDRQHPKDEL